MIVIRWLVHHGAVVQLSLMAVSQAAQLQEESVYHKLTSSNKVSQANDDFLFLFFLFDKH